MPSESGVLRVASVVEAQWQMAPIRASKPATGRPRARRVATMSS